MIADEMNRAVVGIHPQSYADAIAQIFLEPGRAGKALVALDDLRKAGAAPVDARPILSAADPVLGHGHRRWGPYRGVEGEGSAERAQQLGQQPADPGHAA